MNLAATMTLNGGGFLGPLQAIRKDVASIIGTIRGLGLSITGLGGAFAAFKSAEAIVGKFFDQFEKGAELQKLSRITGESVSNLVVLQKAFKNARMDAGGLDRMIIMLQKSLGGVNEQGEPTKHIFDQLGLSVEKLQQLKTPQALEAIGEKLRALPNPAQRTATAMAIFGRSGAEMLALLSDPTALSGAMKEAKEMGALYQRNAKIFSEIIRLFESIKTKVSTLFAGLAEGVAPALKSLLETVKKIDLAAIGRDLGAIFGAIPAAIKSGQIAELLEMTLQLGFAKGVNFFTASMSTAMATLGETLGFVFSNLGGIADVLVGAAAQFGAAMLSAVQKPLAYVQAFFEHLANPGTKIGSFARHPAMAGAFPMASLATSLLGGKDGTDAPKSLDQTVAQIMKSGGPKFGFGGKAMNAAEIAAAGRAQSTEGFNSLRQPLAGLAQRIGEIMKSFKIEDVTGAAEIGKRLRELVQSLNPSTKTKPDASAPSTNEGLLGTRIAKIDSDRLARVGGFIGAGGPANDYARRTADNTAKMVEHIRTLPHVITHAIVYGSYDGRRAPGWGG
jgi:hypothetical protein